MFLYGRDAVAPSIALRPRPVFSLSTTLINILCNFLIAFALYLLNFKLLKSKIHTHTKHLLILVLSIILTITLSYIFSKIQLRFYEHILFTQRFIHGGMMRDFFIMMLVILSAQLMFTSYKQQQTELENKTLLSENMRARYEVLKNQVNPHFLFNSLNTLNSLIKIDEDKAQEYVQQLSQVLRYTLQKKEVISLEEELKFALSYFHLMQIRYGENLKLENCIKLSSNDCLIVPLSLQMLIENAIKHNVISKKNPLVITMEMCNDKIVISNPIIPKKEFEASEGIGLENLAERYRLMWKINIVVTKENKKFIVEIPLIKQA